MKKYLVLSQWQEKERTVKQWNQLTEEKVHLLDATGRKREQKGTAAGVLSENLFSGVQKDFSCLEVVLTHPCLLTLYLHQQKINK